jgi:hypothetical protein
MSEETSKEVASIAARLLKLTGEEVLSDPMLLADIKSVAASALTQARDTSLTALKKLSMHDLMGIIRADVRALLHEAGRGGMTVEVRHVDRPDADTVVVEVHADPPKKARFSNTPQGYGFKDDLEWDHEGDMERAGIKPKPE